MIAPVQHRSTCTRQCTPRHLVHTTHVNKPRRLNARFRLVATSSETGTHSGAAATSSASEPLHSNTLQPAQDSSSSSTSFVWSQYWYPVHVVDQVDPSRPHAIQLLGKQLVLWRDGQGVWRCNEDACPHRLAPLSEGRIEADGTLQCSYHGWRFDSAGKCVEIPQAVDAKAKAVACASSRSCVASYPVQEKHGIIWVWPTAGAAAAEQAASAHLPVSQALEAASAAGRSTGWYRRELPYSWDILVENLTDPSHLPFLHHNLYPGLKRSSGGPMPFKAVAIPAADSDNTAARPIYCMAAQNPVAAFEYPAGFTAGSTVAFTPPCAVVYESKGGLQTELLAVPSAPGRALAFTAGVPSTSTGKVTGGDVVKALFTNPKQAVMLLARMKFERTPTYQSHLRSNKLFDQDSVFLTMQDRKLAQRGKSSWAQEYYMPVPCDGAIIAARRWADNAMQQPISPAPSAPPAATAITLSQRAAASTPAPTKHQINDRYNQHTKHCVICQKALAALQQRLAAARAAAASLVAAAIGVLAGVVLPKLLAGGVGAGGVGAAGASAGAAAVVLVALGVGAALAAAVAAASEQVEQFMYVEYSHADNH